VAQGQPARTYSGASCPECGGSTNHSNCNGTGCQGCNGTGDCNLCNGTGKAPSR
jgi:hypothetical protein